MNPQTAAVPSPAPTRSTKWIPILIIVLFLFIRLPGLAVPYYQDEWKNVAVSASVEKAGEFFAHPPLMQMLFVADYALFGVDGFRILPLLITGVALWLLYVAVRNRAGDKAATWAMLIGAFCFYNILGALQTDVDGSVLPFCFLLAVIAYDKIRSHTERAAATANKKELLRVNGWIVVFTVALLVGLLTKLSFGLVVAVFALEYIWSNRRSHPGIYIGRCIAYGLVFAGMYIGLLYAIQALYPAFSIANMLGHAQQFTEKEGRGWMQIVVQGVKALYYLSPLVIAPIFLVSRETLRKMRPFLLYLIIGAVFYFVAFDFSQGALDKYLMFATVPLIALASVAIVEAIGKAKSVFVAAGMRLSFGKVLASLVPGIAIAALIFWTNFLNPAVVALYPKSEWFGRVLQGDWNILTPITGGSGPMGFYVSFLFIAASFIAAILAAILGRLAMNGRFGEARKIWLVPMLGIICVVGVVYNFVFAEEYMFGDINGSSAKVLAANVEFIRQTPLITKVLTYNDTGAGPLTEIDAYAGRIYANPGSEEFYRAKFAAFSAEPKTGYLVIDVPRLYKDGFFAKYFESCTILYHNVSKQISGTVYRCPKP